MNEALLDTDIYSEILESANPIVTRKVTVYRNVQGILTLSTITVMEIVKGFQRTRAARRLDTFLAAISVEGILPLEEPAADMAGRIAGELERIGQPIGLCDPMIAAIALHHGLELVTGNTAHFQRIQRLGYPLTLVDWRV